MAVDEELKQGLKAFKKRLKLTRLDDESGLSRGNNRKSAIAGIRPPAGFPPRVWQDLVAQGKLKDEGSGTYSLGDVV